MTGGTRINPFLKKTELNREIGDLSDLRSGRLPAVNIEKGDLIGGEYEVEKPLELSSGEADLFLCKKDGETFVAKVYRRRRAVKPKVVESLMGISSPYVATIYSSGLHEGVPYEILPYYKNGSLAGKRFGIKELKETVIPCINEALRELHKNDVIHKDLKPSNVMLTDDGKGVAIIDFGVSSVVEGGNTVIITKTGMTPEYSAPETFRSLFLEESDYYSFGITLYELYCGHTPYTNMTAEEIAQLTTVQCIPFPEDMPSELKELISALTYYDITNRHKKANPNRRWTYEEVDKWLRGIEQVVPGEGAGFAVGTMPKISFGGEIYNDIPSFISALARNWQEGKSLLYRGKLAAFFKKFNAEVAGICRDTEEDAARLSGRDDLLFFKWLYRVHPRLSPFYWQGREYESLPALGRDILEKLWKKDGADEGLWRSILENKLLTEFLSRSRGRNERQYAAVEALEKDFETSEKTDRSLAMSFYTMGYLLSGQRLFCFRGARIKSVEELSAYMKQLLDASYKKLEDFCHKLVGYDDELDVQFEAWLISLGKAEQIRKWRKSLI